MGYPRNLLAEDETIVYEMRPHWRALVFPVLAFFLTVGIGSYLWAKTGGWIDNESTRSGTRWTIVAVIALLLIIAVVRPLIFWMTTLYVLTDHRIIVRSGFIARRGRDMPLSRVNDVSFNHTMLERFVNCGTLVVESAGTNGQLVIANVPNVERIQREIYRLHDEDDIRRRTGSDNPDASSGT